MKPASKVLKWGKPYDLADLYDDQRLSGFVVAAVESGMHGVRLNLVAVPDGCTPVYLEEGEEDSSRT